MIGEREPHALALIVCDGVHTDPGTGKKTLLGLFSTVVGPEYPLTLPRLCVYAALTECIGKLIVEIKLVDVNEERDPVFSITGEIDGNDPLAVLDMSFLCGNAVFPEIGEYRVQLYAAGTPIMERRLMAIKIQPRSLEEES